ncbi:MAG: ABC transporter substrate-binding protein [Firmicutes bacterium]|nr:ABC transporter substrate-binding protein [Bacillota bacterium]
MRKTVIYALVILACISSVWSSAYAATKPVEVTLWHGWTGDWTKVIDDIVKMFNDSHPGIKVKPLVVPYGERDTKLMAAIAAGNPPDIIYTMGNTASYAARGAMIPIDELMTPQELADYKRYQWPMWQANVYKGHLWTFHGFIDVMALYYNKGHFKQAGLDPNEPPKDIATLDSYAEKLTVHDSRGNITRLGFLPENLLWWGAVFGGDWFKEGKVTANDPEIIKAGEWFASYSKKYDVKKLTAFQGGLAEERARALDPFISGKYSMQLMGQWKILDIAKYAPKDFDYGIVPLPTPPGGRKNAIIVPSGYGLIPKGAKHPKEALQYLLYWVGKGYEEDRAKIMTMGGWMPLADGPWQARAAQDYMKQYPHFKVFVDLLRNGQVVSFASPVELFYSDRLTQAEDRIRLLQETPKQSLDRVTKEVQAELDKIK